MPQQEDLESEERKICECCDKEEFCREELSPIVRPRDPELTVANRTLRMDYTQADKNE
jgi:hypothetical protein